MLTQEQKNEICKILKKKSKFVYKDKACENTIRLLERIRSGEIKLADIVPGMRITFEDFLYERDLLLFVT